MLFQTMTKTAYVALGSNLGDQVQNLKDVVPVLQSLSDGSVTGSSIWASQPEGFGGPAEEFANAVIQLQTDLSAVDLLKGLQRIEERYGRDRADVQDAGYQPRVMDLDIVAYDSQVLVSPGLTLPHPRAMQRRFVLLPLQEIAPGFRFPNRRESLQTLLDQAPENPMRPITPLIP